jgi:toxin ParE1/3/4
MNKVAFTDNAKQALREIVTYTKIKWGSTQALSYVSGLKKQTKILANLPTLGKIYTPYQSKEVRVYPFERHLIYYRQMPDGITVIHITHKNMDQSDKLKPEEPS